MDCLLRDIRRINKHKTFGDNVNIEFVDDDMSKLTLKLNVVEGLHAGANYLFRVEFRDNELLQSTYAPRVVCLTSVFHPNIVEDERVCCNLLGDEWEAGTTLEGVITALYCLLDNPELDNALEGWKRGLVDESSESGSESGSDDDSRRNYYIENYIEDLERFIKRTF